MPRPILYIDDTQIAAGRIDAAVPLAFSGDEPLYIGSETATPVLDDCDSRGSIFTGRSTPTAALFSTLTIAKSVDPTTITRAGQSIDYSFVVINTGNVSVSAV